MAVTIPLSNKFTLLSFVPNNCLLLPALLTGKEVLCISIYVPSVSDIEFTTAPPAPEGMETVVFASFLTAPKLLFTLEQELSVKQQKGIKMWISRKKYKELEKRVADLEKSQLRATEMVKEYIEDTESLSNVLERKIEAFPETIKKCLSDYCSDK